MDVYYRIVLYVLTGVVGLCVGSFLNVVIYRVPEGMSLAQPPSHCPRCQTRLKWYDNIPVLSYVLLRGRCRYCGDRISPRYMAVELLHTALWLLCAWRFAETAPVFACMAAAVCSLLVCVAFIDLEHQIIPDRFHVMLALPAAMSFFFDPAYDWLSHLLGGIGALVVFAAVGWGVSRLVGQEALGGGDVKLAAVVGAFLGWERFLPAMLIASLSASVVLLCVRKRRADDKATAYPFAPFLSTGFIVSTLFGTSIVNGYLALLMG